MKSRSSGVNWGRRSVLVLEVRNIYLGSTHENSPENMMIVDKQEQSKRGVFELDFCFGMCTWPDLN